MRVLAVAQVLHLLEAEVEAVREGLVGLGRHEAPLAQLHLREVGGDRGLVAAGVAERLLREVEPGRRVDAALAVELLEQQRVVGGVHHDGDVAEVLGGGAHHRRPADVDVLERLVEATALRDLVLERVEVHHHHVDRGNAVRLERLHVLGQVAAREDAAVDLRVQRLHAPVEDLREAGGLRDARHLDARLLELLRGAARRQHLEPALGEAAGELDEALLARDRQQRTACHGASGWACGTTSRAAGMRVVSPFASRHTASQVAAVAVTARE